MNSVAVASRSGDAPKSDAALGIKSSWGGVVVGGSTGGTPNEADGAGGNPRSLPLDEGNALASDSSSTTAVSAVTDVGAAAGGGSTVDAGASACAGDASKAVEAGPEKLSKPVVGGASNALLDAGVEAKGLDPNSDGVVAAKSESDGFSSW